MASRLRRGWKILRLTRQSYVVAEPDHVVEYRRGRRAYPRPMCGPLAVFTTKRAAMDFLRFMGRRGGDGGDPCVIIVPCRYKPSRAAAMWVESYTNNYQGHAFSHHLPAGGALADFVTCLE